MRGIHPAGQRRLAAGARTGWDHPPARGNMNSRGRELRLRAGRAATGTERDGGQLETPGDRPAVGNDILHDQQPAKRAIARPYSPNPRVGPADQPAQTAQQAGIDVPTKDPNRHGVPQTTMVRTNLLGRSSFLSSYRAGRLADETAVAVEVQGPGRRPPAAGDEEVIPRIHERNPHAEASAQEFEEVLALPGGSGPGELYGRTRTVFQEP